MAQGLPQNPCLNPLGIDISDPRSYEHYWTSSWNKTWKKIQARTGFEPMTSAIPMQRSTNWANKPTGLLA